MNQIESNSHSDNSYYARARTWLIFFLFLGAFGLFLAVSFTFAAEGHSTGLKKSPARMRARDGIHSQKSRDRFDAIESLRRREETVSDDEIKSAMASETDSILRHRLQQLRVQNEAPQVWDDLVASLKTDPSGVVRQGAAQALANYVRQQGVPAALAEALRKDLDPAVRYACARSLALSQSFTALHALDLASRDSDPDMRAQAAFSLKRQTSPEAKKILQRLRADAAVSVRDMAGEDQ